MPFRARSVWNGIFYVMEDSKPRGFMQAQAKGAARAIPSGTPEKAFNHAG